LAKTGDAGKPNGSEEKKEKSLESEGIDAYENHIIYAFL
jgi:hypothetical protein